MDIEWAAVGMAASACFGVLCKWVVDLLKLKYGRDGEIDRTAVGAYERINTNLQEQINLLVARVQTVEQAESECRETLAALKANYQHVREEIVYLRSRLSAGQDLVLAEHVLNQMTYAVVTIDETGKIAAFNPAAVRLLGWLPAEVIGQPISKLMPDPDARQHSRYIANYLRTKEAKIIGIGRRVNALHKDGHLVPIQLEVSDAPLGEGRHLFTGILRPVEKQ